MEGRGGRAEGSCSSEIPTKGATLNEAPRNWAISLENALVLVEIEVCPAKTNWVFHGKDAQIFFAGPLLRDPLGPGPVPAGLA